MHGEQSICLRKLDWSYLLPCRLYSRGMSEYRSGGRNRTVVIVGAGPGGLAAAMLMAQRGFRVQVFEKQDVIGGRNAEVHLGVYRFDLGPTFLMMKFLLDALFAEGGRRSSHYLDFRQLDPMYALNFSDKTRAFGRNPRR